MLDLKVDLLVFVMRDVVKDSVETDLTASADVMPDADIFAKFVYECIAVGKQEGNGQVELIRHKRRAVWVKLTVRTAFIHAQLDLKPPASFRYYSVLLDRASDCWLYCDRD